MDFLNNWILTILIFLPMAGAILVLMAPTRDGVRWTALGTTIVTFLASLLLFTLYDWNAGSGYGYLNPDGTGGVVQLVQHAKWIPAFNIEYRVGIDGLSFPLVILSTFICVLAGIASWNIDKMSKGYWALFLFLETGILGVFLSLDFFLFYVFFEVSLLPMYFLIGIWGGPRKEYAAIKFFLYTLVGSIGLLIVLIGTYLLSRGFNGDARGTFDLIMLASPAFQDYLTQQLGGGAAALAGTIPKTFFVLLMIGFLIKVPAVPFHTWLPDAHVEAPTPISMILAAILLKMGGYGIFRIAYPLYPEAAKAMWLLIAIVGVVSVIYGALCAMSQTDFKKLVAYSSVSHMGFVVLGAAMMTDAAVNGALFMMVAHGITSAMMFFLVGVIYERAHHREISRFGGLASTMPQYWGFSTVGFFANLGLPGLCGFIGEVMVLIGSFAAARASYDVNGNVLEENSSILMYATNGAAYWPIMTLAIIACFGVILTAGYMLQTMQRVFFGPEKAEYQGFAEVDGREIAVLTPLTIMAILLGILPTLFFFAFTDSTVKALFGVFNKAAAVAGGF